MRHNKVQDKDWQKQVMELRKAAAVFFWTLSLIALLIGAFFVWILKDGLGPDAIDSHGLIALQRFGSGMAWIVGLYVLPPSLIGCALYPWQSAKFAKTN